MKKTVYFSTRQTISAFLVLVLFLSLCPVAAHAEAYGTIAVYSENNRFSLGVMNSNRGWYVNSEDLARIGNLRLSNNTDQKKITIYRDNPFVILYTADSTTYQKVGNNYYIPFQEASVACGIRFYEINNDIFFEVLRTPKDLLSELSKNVFGNSLFRLSDLYLGMGGNWIALETSARVYAILSSFSLSAYVKALSGEADQERYNQAMATIITNDNADISSFAALADINKYFTKTDKILDAFDWLFEKSSKFYYWFTGSNWMQAEFQTYMDQLGFYGEFGGVREFLNAYSDVSKMLDLKYIFNVILYIETVLESEENVVNAMQKVFSTSDNEHARLAASKVIANRYGVGLATIDVAGNAAIEVSSKKIDSLFSDLVFGELNWKAKVDKFIATQIFEYGFQLPDKSDAVIYLPIYSAIQQDLALYFYNNYYTDSNDNYTDLRSAGIMYLKAAIAAYKNFDFDNSLSDTVSTATDTLRSELNELLSYGDCEYAPEYTNQIVIDYVSRNGESYGLSHNKWMNGFGRVTTETENPGDEQVLEDGIYHGQFSWEANNCFANGEDRAVLTLCIPKDSQWIIENDYHGELLVESKTIMDEWADEPAFASWHVTVDRVAYENGEYCFYTRSVYNGEVLVFRESDNTYYVMTETVIPFTESAQVTDYAICIDYLYDYSKSPNVFSWRDLGAYYNNNFCYDVCYDVWAYITVVNGKITAMEFEYLP